MDDLRRPFAGALVAAALSGLLSLSCRRIPESHFDASGLPLTPREAGCDVQPGRSVTSSRSVPDMTLEMFAQTCAERGGVVELHASCGGVNSCAGLSFNSDIGVLTEHGCAGLNTCTGFSCVPD